MKDYYLHPLANQESVKDGEFYFERGGKKLAGHFALEILEAIEEIQADPKRHEFVRGKIQSHGPTKRFKYRIYFEETPTQINISAIANPKRKPWYWVRRKFKA